MLAVGTKARLVVGLFGVFGTVLAFCALVTWVYPKAALAACIALATCIVIFFQYRWHVKPPVYDQPLREIRALAVLSPLINDVFLPFTSFPLEPEALLEIVNYIQVNDCTTIVECGSGVSTVVIGNLLRQRGRGHLYSLEDDEAWYNSTSELLAKQGLEQYVTFVFAPLQPVDGFDLETRWYAQDKVRAALQGVEHVDLILVDGPKSLTTRSRVAALPFFVPWMDNHTLLVLDDAKRPQERAVLEEWRQKFDVETDLRFHTVRGQAYVRLQGEGKAFAR